MEVIPAGETIAELERKAAAYDRDAEGQPEPAATSLKKLADLCREWASALKSGKWIP